ncbi:MAG: type II toxin-antitoxin system ParD family antitoxin [Chromatiales bacterium]|nr:type II toxin-antitoxin system ParD family antitoxin [Chromatiales bacterium]
MAQAKTQTLSLGEHWNGFIATQVEQGRYASASEVVRDALRLLEEKHAQSKLEALRQAIIDGENSGAARPLDMQAIVKEARSRAGLND